MDKRKQKSQKIIMDAFLELLKEKDFEKISMNDIAEKANVNRGTIYLNYVDKYDLMDKCIEVNFGHLLEECKFGPHVSEKLNKESFARTFKYFENHTDFLQNLFRNAGFAAYRKC